MIIRNKLSDVRFLEIVFINVHFSIILLLSSNFVHAQNLIYNLKRTTTTNQINSINTNNIGSLFNLARKLHYKKPDSAICLYKEVIQLSKPFFNIPYLKNEANRLTVISNVGCGDLYKNKEEYLMALDYYKKALDMYIETEDIFEKGFIHCEIAQTYIHLNDFSNALKYYSLALEFYKKNKDIKGEIYVLQQIGICYLKIGDQKESVSYIKKALSLSEEIHDTSNVYKNLCTLGSIYYFQKNHKLALEYMLKSIKIEEDLGGKNDISYNLAMVGLIYDTLGDRVNAIRYYWKAAKICFKLKNYNGYNKYVFEITNGGNSKNELLTKKDSNIIWLDIMQDISNEYVVAHQLEKVGRDLLTQEDWLAPVEYIVKALNIYLKLNKKEDAARMYGFLGMCYFEGNEYFKALECSSKSLQLIEEIGDKQLMALNNENIGLAIEHQGDYKKARVYFYNSLKLYSQTNDADGFIKQIGNICRTFYREENYEMAKKIELKILYIQKLRKQKESMANSLRGIGHSYIAQKNYLIGLEYYFNSLKINKEIICWAGIAEDLMVIGICYHVQKEYDKALNYYLDALEANKKINNKDDNSMILYNIGTLYLDMANSTKYSKLNNMKFYANSEKYLLLCEDFYKQNPRIFDPENVKIKIKTNLSFVYEKTGRYQLSLKYYKDAMKANDSILNLNKNQETIIKMRRIIDEISEESAKKERGQQEEIKNVKLTIKIIIGSVTAGILFLIILTIFYTNKKRKENKLRKDIEDLNSKVMGLKIPPHFIKNSINAIKDHIIVFGVESSLEYLDMLARLMISVIINSKDDEISLEEDLNTLDVFIKLRNLPRENKVNVIYDISKNINPEKIKIIPNLIQPIVENSFDHAYSGISNPELRISIFIKDKMIHFIIQDNGMGFKQNQAITVNQIGQRTKIGLDATMQRINIINRLEGSKAFIVFKDLFDKKQRLLGAFVEMAVPLKIEF